MIGLVLAEHQRASRNLLHRAYAAAAGRIRRERATRRGRAIDPDEVLEANRQPGKLTLGDLRALTDEQIHQLEQQQAAKHDPEWSRLQTLAHGDLEAEYAAHARTAAAAILRTIARRDTPRCASVHRVIRAQRNGRSSSHRRPGIVAASASSSSSDTAGDGDPPAVAAPALALAGLQVAA